MTKPLIPRPQHSDLHPKLGPGLFDDDRVHGSIDRAVVAIAEYIANLPDDEKKLTRAFDELSARKILRDPIRSYWTDNNYDTRVKFSNLKIQARKLRSRVESFDKSIKNLSAPMKAALRMSFTRQYGEAKPGENRLTVTQEMNAAIIVACNELIKPKYKKTEELGVGSLAGPLWNYWESMRAVPFRRSWDECETRLSLIEKVGPVSFSRTDALFVQVAISAIDPNVLFSDIRTRLKEVAKERPSKGKSTSVVAHRPRKSALSTTAKP